jgi:hypothetical protein
MVACASGVGARPAAAAALVAALLAAGCGAASRPVAAPQQPPRSLAAAAPEADVPAGYRLHRSYEAGVSLALPLGWRAVAGPDARYPGVIQTLARVHRAFLPYLTALASPGSPLKLFGFDPASSAAHPSIVSVQQLVAGRTGPYARWSQRALRSLATLGSLRGHLASSRADVPAGPALRVAFARSDGDRVLLYVVATRGGLWAVTFAAPPRAPGRRTWDRAAATLQVAAPHGGPRIAGGTGATPGA